MTKDKDYEVVENWVITIHYKNMLNSDWQNRSQSMQNRLQSLLAIDVATKIVRRKNPGH